MLPLLSSGPAVTFPAAEHHRSLADTKLYCLVTEEPGCKELNQGCYTALHIHTYNVKIEKKNLELTQIVTHTLN